MRKQRLAIVIIILGKVEAKKLYISKLGFRNIVKVIQIYQKAETSFIYMTC